MLVVLIYFYYYWLTDTEKKQPSYYYIFFSDKRDHSGKLVVTWAGIYKVWVYLYTNSNRMKLSPFKKVGVATLCCLHQVRFIVETSHMFVTILTNYLPLGHRWLLLLHIPRKVNQPPNILFFRELGMGDCSSVKWPNNGSTARRTAPSTYPFIQPFGF